MYAKVIGIRMTSKEGETTGNEVWTGSRPSQEAPQLVQPAPRGISVLDERPSLGKET